MNHPKSYQKSEPDYNAIYDVIIACRKGEVHRNVVVEMLLPLADIIAASKRWPWRSRDEVHELAYYHLTPITDWLIKTVDEARAIGPKVRRSLTIRIWKTLSEGLIRIPSGSRYYLVRRSKLATLNLAVESAGIVQESPVSIGTESLTKSIIEKLAITTESDYDFLEIVEKSCDTHAEYHSFLQWSLGFTFKEIALDLDQSAKFISVMVHRVIERLKLYYD